MRRVELLGLLLAAGAWAGCEAIAGLGDFGPEPTTTGGTGGTGAAAGGGSTPTGSGGSGGGAGQGGEPFTQPAAIYSRAFGSPGAEEFKGLDSTTDSIFIAGTHTGELQIVGTHANTQGGKNPFFARLGPNLAPQWSSSYESTGTTNVAWLSAGGARPNIAGMVTGPIDFGGGLLTPDDPTDAYWVQFDANGSYGQSAMGHATEAHHAWGIAAHAGGAIMGGLFGGDLTFPGDPETMIADGIDGFVVRFRDDGTAVWATHFSGSDTQEVRSVVVDAVSDPGRIFAAGIHKSDAIVAIAGQGESCTLDHSGPSDAGALTFDAFIVILDLETGDCVDARTFQDSSGDIVARDLAYRQDGLAFVGSFRGTLHLGAATGAHDSQGDDDAFVARFYTATDAIGNANWSKAYGSGGTDIAHSVAIDVSHNVILVGEFEQSIDFGWGPQTANGADAFVVKLNASGAHLWSGAYGGPDRDVATRVCVDADANVIVGGEFDQQIYFGNELLLSNNDTTDVFVAKFAPDPP